LGNPTRTAPDTHEKVHLEPTLELRVQRTRVYFVTGWIQPGGHLMSEEKI